MYFQQQQLKLFQIHIYIQSSNRIAIQEINKTTIIVVKIAQKEECMLLVVVVVSTQHFFSFQFYQETLLFLLLLFYNIVIPSNPCQNSGPSQSSSLMQCKQTGLQRELGYEGKCFWKTSKNMRKPMLEFTLISLFLQTERE